VGLFRNIRFVFSVMTEKSSRVIGRKIIQGGGGVEKKDGAKGSKINFQNKAIRNSMMNIRLVL